MSEPRYLLQTKKNKYGVTKRFIFGWTPSLSEKRDLREVTKEVAEAVLKGKPLPIENDLSADLPNDVITVHVKKEFLSQVLNFIENLEEKERIQLPPSANFPEVTLLDKDKTAAPENNKATTHEIRAINLIQSKNGVEQYIKNKGLKVTTSRKDTLAEMKTKVIECLST